MKVFISWSGQRSAAVADALRYWLPKVIQALEPWMSADDIEKGTRWRSGIATELEQSSVGIICLTRENLDSTWIHFEAGALSKQQQNTYVCTLLFGLEPTDVREPLAQFQATRAQKDDVRKLVFTINSTLGDSKLPDSELSETFEVWWPKLEERLSHVGEITATTTQVRTDRELLEEILNIIRNESRTMQLMGLVDNKTSPVNNIGLVPGRRSVVAGFL
jgi:TIR domain-containing protein